MEATHIYDEKNFSNDGLSTFIGWSRLKNAIAQEVDLKPNEVVTGIVIEEHGIRVQLITKRS